MIMRMTGKMIASFALATLATAVPTFALNISAIEAQPSGTLVTLDSNPVVTAIGSVPQTLDGYTYTNPVFITQDASGSLEFFGKIPAGSTLPSVGEKIGAMGTYSPFNAIPELGTLTSLTGISLNNPLPPSPIVTAAQVAGITSSSLNILGYYITLDNVLISQQNSTNTVPGNFPTHANGTYTLTDVGGSTPLTMFQYASSYSAAGELGGTAVPTGPVDITGIADVFGTPGTPEFIPFSITAVPEPTSVGFLGLGVVGLMKRNRSAKAVK